MYKKVITIISIIILATTPIIVSAEHPASQNYSLQQPRVVISIGKTSSDSYTLNDVVVGSIFGGKAESESYSLTFYPYKGSFHDVIVLPLVLSWRDLTPGQTTINLSNKILVTNAGDVNTTYHLHVEDASNPNSWHAGIENGEDYYSMRAIFTDEAVESVTEADFGQDDTVLESANGSTIYVFASDISSGNGYNVPPKTKRALWLKFTAPDIDRSQQSQHNLFLTIEAKEVN
ncbi:MAG: hypothetical protein ISS34_05770 [Candidatus Omnitrophica bacterium]|nr:hypothetical protein [Candidatus Omnitrophota bacterium]